MIKNSLNQISHNPTALDLYNTQIDLQESIGMSIDKVLKVGIATLGVAISLIFCPVSLNPFIGMSIYWITNQFFNSKNVFKNEFAVISKDFDVISAQNLQTNAARKKYLQFLINHAKESPSIKLFGWKVDVVSISESEAKKHINLLRLSIHPDKALRLCVHPNEIAKEEKLINELFDRVQTAAKEYFKKDMKSNTVSREKFLEYLTRANWISAKKFLENYSEFTLIFALREGDFLTAIQSCSKSILFEDFVEIIERCLTNLNHLPSLKHVNKLLKSLEEIQRLSVILKNRLEISWMKSELVPHKLYLAIAACYENSSHHAVEYQKFLRLAIRCCLVNEEKTDLIEILKKHIQHFQKHFKVNKQGRISLEINTICKEFKYEMYKTLTENSLETLRPLIKEFKKNHKNLEALEMLLKELDKLIEKEYLASNIFPSFLKSYVDNVFAYSDSELESVSYWHKLLKGVHFFQKKEYGNAACYFESERKSFHLFFHGLCEFELKNFRGALHSFAKLSEGDNFMLEFSFDVMNQQDFDLNPEVQIDWLLQEIDEFQIQILKNYFSFYSSEI